MKAKVNSAREEFQKVCGIAAQDGWSLPLDSGEFDPLVRNVQDGLRQLGEKVVGMVTSVGGVIASEGVNIFKLEDGSFVRVRKNDAGTEMNLTFHHDQKDDKPSWLHLVVEPDFEKNSKITILGMSFSNKNSGGQLPTAFDSVYEGLAQDWGSFLGLDEDGVKKANQTFRDCGALCRIDLNGAISIRSGEEIKDTVSIHWMPCRHTALISRQSMVAMSPDMETLLWKALQEPEMGFGRFMKQVDGMNWSAWRTLQVQSWQGQLEVLEADYPAPSGCRLEMQRGPHKIVQLVWQDQDDPIEVLRKWNRDGTPVEPSAKKNRVQTVLNECAAETRKFIGGMGLKGKEATREVIPKGEWRGR